MDSKELHLHFFHLADAFIHSDFGKTQTLEDSDSIRAVTQMLKMPRNMCNEKEW